MGDNLHSKLDNTWDPVGIYESQDDSQTVYRLKIGERIHKLGRYDLPKGKWFYGEVDSNGIFKEHSFGYWNEVRNNAVLCFNNNDSYGFEALYEKDGIRINGGRYLKKVS